MARILIIDDDPDLVESMKVVLDTKGYEVISASTGKEGLNKVKHDKPDLVILDIAMETGDKGFEVARQLKKDKDHKNIPILMLTAIKDKTGLDFKSEAGDQMWLPVDDYCEKPLDHNALFAKVEKLLHSK